MAKKIDSLSELKQQAEELGVQLDYNDNMDQMVHNFNPFLQNYHIMVLQVKSNQLIMMNKLQEAEDHLSALYDWIETFMRDNEKKDYGVALKKYYEEKTFYYHRKDLMISFCKPLLKTCWKILHEVMKKNGLFLPYTKYGL